MAPMAAHSTGPSSASPVAYPTTFTAKVSVGVPVMARSGRTISARRGTFLTLVSTICPQMRLRHRPLG